jgi:hypothetical protein
MKCAVNWVDEIQENYQSRLAVCTGRDFSRLAELSAADGTHGYVDIMGGIKAAAF